MYYYSASLNGFYTSKIHGKNIPSDSIEITDELYKNLIDGQCYGKRIIPDIDGNPILSEYIQPSIEKKSENTRVIRNNLLSSCDWTMLSDVVLSDDLKNAWKSYRQSLRDITTQKTFPDVVWPNIPGTINTPEVSGT